MHPPVCDSLDASEREHENRGNLEKGAGQMQIEFQLDIVAPFTLPPLVISPEFYGRKPKIGRLGLQKRMNGSEIAIPVPIYQQLLVAITSIRPIGAVSVAIGFAILVCLVLAVRIILPDQSALFGKAVENDAAWQMMIIFEQ